MQSGILNPGEVCGGYRVITLIGFGGVAEVYKAVHATTGEIVALKTLHPFHAGNAYVTEHMLAEAELLSKLNHENVVQVKDVGVDRGMLWMAMEFLSGMTLRKLVKRSGALSIPTALYYARETADGVAAAHEMQVIHRDLKPENIFITTENKVKVLDLGAAKFYEWDLKSTVPGTVFGTPLYMSPEHIREQPTDTRSDIYSLGLILYEMVAGYHPFANLGKYEICEKQLNVDPPLLSSIRDNCPALLSDLTHRALAKERAERPATMNEFAQSVRAILRSVLAGAGELESLPEIREEDGLEAAPASATERRSEELTPTSAGRRDDSRSSSRVTAPKGNNPISARNAGARPVPEAGRANGHGGRGGAYESSAIEEARAKVEGISDEIRKRVAAGGRGSEVPRHIDDNAAVNSSAVDADAEGDCPTLVMTRSDEEMTPAAAVANVVPSAPSRRRERTSKEPMIAANGTLRMQSPGARAEEIARQRALPNAASSRLYTSRDPARREGAAAPGKLDGSVTAPMGSASMAAPRDEWNAAFANASGGLSMAGAMPVRLTRAHLLEYTLWAALVAVMLSVVAAFVSAHLREKPAGTASASFPADGMAYVEPARRPAEPVVESGRSEGEPFRRTYG
jgi:serine/threonine protein kinase